MMSASAASSRFASIPQTVIASSLTPLIGRDAAVADVCQWLTASDTRLVTITGPAGVGKTLLAITVAEATGPQWPGGARIVGLADVSDAEGVCPAIARQLELRDPGPGDTRTPAEWVAAALGEAPPLLVLDNLEQVVDVAPELDALLSARDDLHLLVTSRVPLRLPEEREYRLDPLPTPPDAEHLDAATVMASPAGALFVERARAAQPRFTLTDAMAPTVAALCQRLDGLPLAIELAAARVRVLGPRDILERLESGRFSLASGRDDPLSRRRSLREAIAWSYDLLSPEEQAAFRRLAVFATSWSIDMAEAVITEPVSTQVDHTVDVVDALNTLVDANLVQQTILPDGGTRFAFLQTIRDFAREQLDATGETDGAMGRFADAALAFITEIVPLIRMSGEEALRRVGLEEDNLRVIARWGLTRNDPALTIRLTTEALWFYWGTQGRLKDEGLVLEQAVSLADEEHDRVPPALLAHAMSAVGSRRVALGDAVGARDILERALPIWRAMADGPLRQRGLANTTMNLGVLAMEQGDYDAAYTFMEESLAIRREMDGHRGLVLALNNLGDLANRRGDYATARMWLDEGLELAESVGDYHFAGAILTTLSDTDRLAGDLVASRSHGTQGVALLRHVGDQRVMRQGFVAIARACVGLRRPREALERLTEALTSAQIVGEPAGVASALELLVEVISDLKPDGDVADVETVTRLLGAAAALREEGAPVPEEFRAALDRVTSAAQAALPDALYRTAFGAGRQLTPDAAVAEGTRLAERLLISLPADAEAVPEPAPVVIAADAAAVEAELATGNGRRPASTTTLTLVEPLTRREIEVLQNLVEGMTDQEVAETLSISRRTANNHVSRILGKLGVTSRTAAVSMALRYGLL